MIIGLTGAARSGKDTVADYLVSRHGFSKSAFAFALRREVAESFNINVDILDIDKDIHSPLMNMDRCTDKEFASIMSGSMAHAVNGNFSPRKVMQLWGTEYRRSQDPDYWVNKVKDKVCDGRSWVISDLRFFNEYDILKSVGGAVIRIINPRLSVHVSAHSSEEFWKECKADHDIVNDGSKEDLYNKLEQALWKD